MKAEPKARRSTPPWDRITAISSIVVAVLALIASVYQANLNRELTRDIALNQIEFQKVEAEKSRLHRELSVMPIVSHKRDLALQSEQPGFALENRGIGPALIKNALVYRKGQLVGRADSRASMAALVREFDINYKEVRWQTVAGYTLLPGESVLVISAFASTFPSQQWRDHFFAAIDEMDMAYCYCSMYDRCWRASSWGGTVVAEDGCADGGAMPEKVADGAEPK